MMIKFHKINTKELENIENFLLTVQKMFAIMTMLNTKGGLL